MRRKTAERIVLQLAQINFLSNLSKYDRKGQFTYWFGLIYFENNFKKCNFKMVPIN